MSRTIKRVGVLMGIFVAAVAIYFIANQGTEEKTSTVYTSMEGARLPVVYTEMLGREMNRLYGYRQDMRQTVARDSLTLLPEDRRLKVFVRELRDDITGIRYEIRSLDQERLVERTSLEDWETKDNTISAELPIQNLLSKETEYLLCLIITDKNYGDIRYYTRILCTDSQYADQMINLAEDFSTKTFDYDQARELVTYLETNDTEDNSSLGHVTIRSSFSQLTWGGLTMERKGPVQVTLRELDGIMGQVRLNYMAGRVSSDESTELYEIEENFTMKWSTQRIYLMNYDRTMDQVFTGENSLFSGKRIMLGITNDDNVRSFKSPNGRFVSYTVNRDLWCYDQAEEKAVRVFSFRSKDDDGGRSNYDSHNVKAISVADNGNLDFLVYGYMNRGIHEGNVGVALYRFDAALDTIEEKFFIPVTASYEVLEESLDKISYIGNNDMLFLMIDRAVYGIDLNSNEYMVVADALTDGSYAISESGSCLAWQEGTELYKSPAIHVLNLETGKKDEIIAPSGDVVRCLGFVGTDFIYGIARPGDEWVINGRTEDLPMYALEIVDGNMNVATRYEGDGNYISSVEVESGRIHLERLAQLSAQNYAKTDDDIIVCTTDMGPDELSGIGWYASAERRKLYFVQLDNEIKGNHNIRPVSPKKLTYDVSEILELKANTWIQDTVFYSYGNGHLMGISRGFAEAVALSYEQMGLVTDQNQNIIWNRVDRANSVTVKSPETVGRKITRKLEEFSGNQLYDDGTFMLDARDCILNQILYFIDKGCPVVAYTEGGGYVLIYGYDQYNISIYNPADQTSYKMGLNDAADYFTAMENDFICGVFME